MLENAKNVQINGSTFTDVGRDSFVYYGIKQSALGMLEDRVAAGAFHNSSERFDPPKCHPRTRIAVLNKIRDWYTSNEASIPRVMWLYGPAGAGKSAIAQTMAEECHELGTLAASFFFSRMTPGRNDATRLVATIAYQIALVLPSTQHHIQHALEKDPMIFLKSFETQLRQLVITPLLNVINTSVTAKLGPKLIVIDGLDECSGEKIQQSIVHHFASAVTLHALPLHVLILSRPEQAIRDSFSRPDRQWDYLSLVLGDDYKPAKDIELFLRESFHNIRQTHVLRSFIPEIWPSDDDIEVLVQKSSGQFIFSSTVIRYIESSRHRPMDRLRRVLMVGSREDATPFAELDALYMHILQSADEAQYPTILRIFGLLLCTENVRRIRQPFAIEDFLGLPPGSVYLALADYHSIVKFPPPSPDVPDPNHSLELLHASMADFLVDPARSGGFFVDQGAVHADLFRACMKGVSSYHWTVRLYSSTSLVKHRENARIDKGLLEDSLRFNLSDLFKDTFRDTVSPLSPWYQYGVCSKQIRWIEEQVNKQSFNISKGLFDCHLATLDHHLKGRLLKFIWQDRVAELYTLVNEIQPSTRLFFNYDRTIPRTWSHAGHILGLDVVGAYETIQDMREVINSASFMYDNTVEVEGLYLNFLHDKVRAGKYHINSQVYARTALKCVEYICEGTHNDDNFYGTGYDSDTEYDSDSESDYDTEPALGLRPMVHGCCRTNLNHDSGACNTGFMALPSILLSAGPLPDLADSLRTGKSSQWMEIASARAEYLERYDIWAGQEHEMPRNAGETPRQTLKRQRVDDAVLCNSNLLCT